MKRNVHVAVAINCILILASTAALAQDQSFAADDYAKDRARSIEYEERRSQTYEQPESFVRLPKSDDVVPGTNGKIDFSAPAGFTTTGVLLATTNAATPNVTMALGGNDQNASFVVLNAAGLAILRLHGDGMLRLPPPNGAYLSGKTRWSAAAWVPGNVVHDVTMTNPRDAALGSTSRVTFFNAESLDEVGSPGTTKFRAATLNYYPNTPGAQINYDSVITYHNLTNAYYYRAFSNGTSGDPAKDTFSVKPAMITGSGAVADMYVSGRVTVGNNPAATDTRVTINGSIDVKGNIAAKYQDIAEWVPASEDLEAGTVVVIDASRSNYVRASREEYDSLVAGVVSPQPGLQLGVAGLEKALVATTGRVKVRVDARVAPIRVGDLLVTSNTAGHARKSEPMITVGRALHAPGTILGKALEPLEAGTGEILVLLTLQ